MDGELIGQYRVVAKLGEGGVGEVFKAVDTVLGRAVAIKRLLPEMTGREELVDRFREEARTLAQLHHPNIAILYGVEREGDCLLMVMEYVEGESISALLSRQGALPVERALPLFFQALDGIGYVHARGVVHRDIKGSNLMLGRDGLLKVMDFGISRVLGSERATLVGQLVGTPEYMPPEQVRGEGTEARSDIYSLGILLYAMLSGRTPFDAEGGYAQLRAQVEDEPIPLGDLLPELPGELCDAVMHALAKSPAERYPDVEAFRSALLPFCPAFPESALPEPAFPESAFSEYNEAGAECSAEPQQGSAPWAPGAEAEPTCVLVEAPTAEGEESSGAESAPDLTLVDDDAPTLVRGSRATAETSPEPGEPLPTGRSHGATWGVVAALLLSMNLLGFEHSQPAPVALAPPLFEASQTSQAGSPVEIQLHRPVPEDLSGLVLGGAPADERGRGDESQAAPVRAVQQLTPGPSAEAKAPRPRIHVAAKVRAERPEPEPRAEAQAESRSGWVIVRD
jgi:serine/threonine protein kinase